MIYTSGYEPVRQLVLVVLVPELELEHPVLRDVPSEVDERETLAFQKPQFPLDRPAPSSWTRR